MKVIVYHIVSGFFKVMIALILVGFVLVCPELTQ
jgi:hypothetical protein